VPKVIKAVRVSRGITDASAKPVKYPVIFSKDQHVREINPKRAGG
jgi:hypothetical protein